LNGHLRTTQHWFAYCLKFWKLFVTSSLCDCKYSKLKSLWFLVLVIEVFCLHHFFCCKYSKFKNIFIVFIMLHFFIGCGKGSVEEFHYILNNSWNILTCNCSNIGAKIDFFPEAWTLSRLVEKKKKEEERNKGELKD
jgi:hypothetical protein